MHDRAGRTRKISLPAVVVCLAVAGLLAGGCASAPGWSFAEDPGVRADLRLEQGGVVSGSLVELSNGDLVIDTSIDRGEDVEVIRRGGVDYVYVRGVATGTAVEIRDFDILTRRRIPVRETEGVFVKARGYLGWGSAVAGVLAFFLVRVLQDTQ